MTMRVAPWLGAPWLSAIAGLAGVAVGQQGRAPTLRTGALPADLSLDGRLDEAAWQDADAIAGLTATDPIEGATPVGRTTVRVLADAHAIVIGVRCDDPDPGGIVAWSVARDAWLGNEDHVRIVLGTFADNRTGYVFAVNPRGARYDALIASRGEGENDDWNGVWEARTHRDAAGWSVEIRIPVRSLSFRAGLDAWQFNVERRVHRLLETSRWASPRRDFRVTHMARAGWLEGLPEFDIGLGLEVRPSGIVSFARESPVADPETDADGSLDATWRITPDLVADLTFFTDFAETEVDTRRTNLTRFPLFFPEKRKFFLEGADAFDFGLGLSRDVVAFHSRRIGLADGREVPIVAGGKLTGRIDGTSVGALAVATDDVAGTAPESEMGVVRVRQDVLDESSVGIIATAGDPLDRGGSWLGGADFTFQTSEFLGDRSFLVGVWGLAMDRDDLAGGDRSAYGIKVDYPNDLFDIALTARRVGEDFDPSLGFVARPAVWAYRVGVDYAPRPDVEWLRKTAYELSLSLVTDLDHRWESYRAFTAPINWDLESGERLEFNVVPEGERITEAFEIAEGREISPGEYEFVRYRVTASSASKRALRASVAWWFGDFYDGTLDTYDVDVTWRPSALWTVSATAELNRGRLPQGRFEEDVFGARLDVNFSPDLTLRNFVQHDTDSDSLGLNSRLRWTITPLSELFFVVDYNFQEAGDGLLDTESFATTVKVQHAVRF